MTYSLIQTTENSEGMGMVDTILAYSEDRQKLQDLADNMHTYRANIENEERTSIAKLQDLYASNNYFSFINLNEFMENITQLNLREDYFTKRNEISKRIVKNCEFLMPIPCGEESFSVQPITLI